MGFVSPSKWYSFTPEHMKSLHVQPEMDASFENILVYQNDGI